MPGAKNNSIEDATEICSGNQFVSGRLLFQGLKRCPPILGYDLKEKNNGNISAEYVLTRLTGRKGQTKEDKDERTVRNSFQGLISAQ